LPHCRQAALESDQHDTVYLVIKALGHIADYIVHTIELFENQVESNVLQQLQEVLLLDPE
jgi:hypothetical protein